MRIYNTANNNNITTDFERNLIIMLSLVERFSIFFFFFCHFVGRYTQLVLWNV